MPVPLRLSIADIIAAWCSGFDTFNIDSKPVSSITSNNLPSVINKTIGSKFAWVSLIFDLTQVYMLENMEGAIKIAQSRETGNTEHTIRRKTQHNICWTPLYANKHK